MCVIVRVCMLWRLSHFFLCHVAVVDTCMIGKYERQGKKKVDVFCKSNSLRIWWPKCCEILYLIMKWNVCERCKSFIREFFISITLVYLLAGFFLGNIVKMHEFTQNFNVHKCNTGTQQTLFGLVNTVSLLFHSKERQYSYTKKLKGKSTQIMTFIHSILFL